jgi:hypothetical protein
MLWRIARRGYITWALLVVWNAVMALSVIAIGGPGSWTPGAPVFLLCALSSVALLLAPSMREYVGVGGLFRRGSVARA